ncbi:hypothetical protein HY642_00210 [Candidatus Woesearchaeota archaeon]|nr:hypothetical protein [Candidatus Woesearchaeota archaeon]
MSFIVLNTSSGIFFTRIGLLPHLLKHNKIITTKEVLEELHKGDDIGYKDARIILQYINDKKIQVRDAGQKESISKEFGIAGADASVIALAEQTDGFLATEDRQIEKIGMVRGIRITNSAVLVYGLWKQGEFGDAQARLLLDLLARSGYNKETCMKLREMMR